MNDWPEYLSDGDAALLNTTTTRRFAWHAARCRHPRRLFSLAPERVEDPNGTVNEVQRDALGVVVRRTLLGTARMADGSIVPHGHGPIDRGAPLTSVDEVLADPESALRGVAEITAYDLESAPPRVVVALAEQLPASGDAPQAAVTLTYSDGSAAHFKVSSTSRTGRLSNVTRGARSRCARPATASATARRDISSTTPRSDRSASTIPSTRAPPITTPMRRSGHTARRRPPTSTRSGAQRAISSWLHARSEHGPERTRVRRERYGLEPDNAIAQRARGCGLS
jgi:hypothetical protein